MTPQIFAPGDGLIHGAPLFAKTVHSGAQSSNRAIDFGAQLRADSVDLVSQSPNINFDLGDV